MAKRVFVVHGWGASSNSEWHPWIKKKLEEKGFEVHAPDMPNTEEPEISAWVGKLNEVVGNASEKDYFIGHSIGCQTILRYLESLGEVRVGGCVLVAPWMHLDEQTIKEEGEETREIARPWMETPINFEKVKEIGKEFTVIFSDNDNYVPLSDKEIFKAKLDAKIVVEHGKGHFSEDDGVSELPVLFEEFLKIAER